ncbi:MAG: UDP-N-acetylglucosamine--N-acetylmuramyl-(pentapeptide) pyrophosphoryl-undecaprenol N-acetylglucosamine transferase [Bacteroidetes bacterium ADurb.Bin174]|nr:MAG: UDP-N-acetylglucosamine--N-acetylmuramyl-(pentapeptide) pyrophosphoryl-undecaprenol N-acetylglucosamine transferase [Bacteroidetes bacterium ADurb.Bin174]
MKRMKTKNKTTDNSPKFIISGGGTGGHIFPAISIANALKATYPDADILFVGAENRMEMERVPAAGYPIKGLPVSGFDRKNLLKNIKVLLDLARSMVKAKQIIRTFKPDVAIGVGGYASAPVLRAASAFGIPTLIQEQNSYAGIANKLLAKKASCICVAYDDMERFFPKDKIVKTGNPVRQDLFAIAPKDPKAYAYFGLEPDKKTILIVGGSLGARTINRSVIAHLESLVASKAQVIWQTGKYYIEEAEQAAKAFKTRNLVVTAFVSRMDYAYAVADVVVSRAGASSISELCLLAKPAVLVPSPNVAEDHQTKNAMALVKKDAAILIKDGEAIEKMIPETLRLLSDEKKMAALSKNILKLAEKKSAERIVQEVSNLLSKK